MNKFIYGIGIIIIIATPTTFALSLLGWAPFTLEAVAALTWLILVMLNMVVWSLSQFSSLIQEEEEGE